MPERPGLTPLENSFERYLQDKGKGRGGEGGNYRRNVSRELGRFGGWAAGHRGNNWHGITPDTADRKPIFDDLDTGVFREYARFLAADRGLKQNTVHTYYRYLSAWCGWCVTEGYLQAHFAQRASAMAPLPEDDGRKPGDQQAWTSEQRHTLTRHVDEKARNSIDKWDEFSLDDDTVDKQRARYTALQASRDRALISLLTYTAVRVGELLRDPDDPRRRGVRWDELSLEDKSMTVYRKKQEWDAASLPEPVVTPVRSYRRLLDPPSDRWPVFPSFDHRTLATLVTTELAERGLTQTEIETRRDEHCRDLFVVGDENIRPPSLTTDGARTILQRLSDASGIDVDHPKHEYLAPHGGRRGMGEVLVRAFGYTTAARYLDNSEEMVRERYSHIEAGELGDVATDALDEIDGQTPPHS